MTTTTIERQAAAGRWAAALRWSPATTRAKIGTFLLLCALALATVLALFQVPYRHTIDVGSPGDARRVRGVFNAEGTGGFTYRWTEERALVQLPIGVFPGEADVVLSGNRPGSPPPQVA